MKIDFWDMFFKVFWTASAVALATLSEQIADLGLWWVPVATVLINAALVYIRQQVAKTSV